MERTNGRLQDCFSTYRCVFRLFANFSESPAGSTRSKNVHLLYVAFPQTNVEPYGLFLERDYSQDVQEQAMTKLKDIAAINNIPDTNVNVEIGSPADEIHHLAEKLNADLIVIGTHGQSGLRLLLGSTANAVLHGVKRDVLAVKI